VITRNSWIGLGEKSELGREFLLANRQMGNYRPVTSSKQVDCDEVGYCFWMRLNADCGEVGYRLWRLALGGSRLAASRGFYSYDPELGGSAWITKWLERPLKLS
jgi:hypothetical protein